MTKVNKIDSLTWRLILAEHLNHPHMRACTHTRKNKINAWTTPANLLNLNLWWGLCLEDWQSPPGDSDEQPEFRQMETLLELDERRMTAKTIPSKAALPGAPKFSGDAVQAQNGFGLLLGSCFQFHSIYFGTISVSAIFCLLAANLSEFELKS